MNREEANTVDHKIRGLSPSIPDRIPKVAMAAALLYIFQVKQLPQVCYSDYYLRRFEINLNKTRLVRRLPDPIHKTLACTFLFLIGPIM